MNAGGFREIFLFKKLSVICETVRIMAVIIKFEHYEGGSFLETNYCDDLVIVEIQNSKGSVSIELDIETAVKFSKELRKQIAIAKDNQLKSECNE